MITLGQIAEFISAPVAGDKANIVVNRVLSIDDANFDEKTIGWCSVKNINILKEKKGNVIVSTEMLSKIDFDNQFLNLIPVENPRRAFALVLEKFFSKPIEFGQIHASSIIDSRTTLNPDLVFIGANVVVEEGCSLGKNVSIGHNTVIKSGTLIGNNVSIGSNCTIGGVGFGYEQDEDGLYALIPHVGNVEIHDFVEIGNNVCIDRAVMGSTLLSRNVKIDNLVHIAHGVIIQENSLIIAEAMIAGSVKIGKNVWVGPSSSIRQKISIGDNAMIGMGSVVVKDVPNNETVAGVPAKPISKK